MNESSAVFWKNELVGHVSDVSNDMWYYDGRWACADSVNARDFETFACALDPAHVREIPEDGLLIQVAFDNGLDSLVKAIVRADAAAPGLITLINSNTLTVFAPTNKAFRDLLTALSLNNINQIPILTLQAVLAYHLVTGRVFSSALANGSVSMFAGGSTTVNLTNGTNGGPTISGNGNAGAKANIIATNVMATNGVVHLIDRVLLP